MIAMLSPCSSFTVVSYIRSYKFTDSPLLPSQNTSCVFQQEEAGVTPEARRDPAAILRHGGVAPPPDRVLAALRSPALPFASARFFFPLSPFPGYARGG